MAHANNSGPGGSQGVFGKLLGLATGRSSRTTYPQNQAYPTGGQAQHQDNSPYQAGFPYAQPQDSHGYQQGSQSHGMQQMYPMQGHPQPLQTGYDSIPYQAPAAGWAQPGDWRGHQSTHAAVPDYGHGTNHHGEHYTGHNGRRVSGFNQHNSGGFGHGH